MQISNYNYSNLYNQSVKRCCRNKNDTMEIILNYNNAIHIIGNSPTMLHLFDLQRYSAKFSHFSSVDHFSTLCNNHNQWRNQEFKLRVLKFVRQGPSPSLTSSFSSAHPRVKRPLPDRVRRGLTYHPVALKQVWGPNLDNF